MPDEITNDEGTLEKVDNVFSEAFDKANVEDITPDPSKKEEQTPAEIPATIPPPAAKTDEEIEADKIAKAVTPQQPGETDEAYEQRWKTLQGIYRHEKDEWKEEKTKLTAELEELRGKIPKPAEKEGETDSALKELLSKLDLTDEQKAAMEEYDVEFDIVSKMEGLKRERESAKLKAEMLEKLRSLEEKIQAQLEPATALVKQTADDKEVAAKKAHFDYIEKTHSDYEKYRDDGSILKWIETKPVYQQKAMMLAYSQGSAEDIVELLDGFKDENNIEKTLGNVIDIDKAKADRKAALTPPMSRRGAVNASMNVAADFEGAFDEALNKT